MNACIVRPVKALGRRRPVRHVIFGLLPLLVVGPVVIIVLAVRLAADSAPVRAATAQATATVERTRQGDDERLLQVVWTDDTGTRRTSSVRTNRPSDIPVGAQVTVRYK